MNPDGSTLGTIVNTPTARCFRQIVSAGWANKSDGHVESPVGHFSLVTISPTEMTELVAGVFADHPYDPAQFCAKCDGFCQGLESPLYPGAYIVMEDNDGNTHVTEFLSDAAAERDFDESAKAYGVWEQGWKEQAIQSDIAAIGRYMETSVWDPKAVIENRPEAVSTYEEPVEKLYLVHVDCGEAFDTLVTAGAHECETPDEDLWSIKPESQAL